MSFAKMKQNKGNALANLQQKVNDAENKSSGGGSKDPRKFKHTYDQNTKVGSAVIRLLPWGDGDRVPWVEWQEFSFKSKGGNYWNRSLRTLGQDDPIAELNHIQWERKLGGKDGADEKAVKDRGRKFRYMYNIVVVNDPANPENNGKNFIYEAGPSIHKKIIAAMVPEHADIASVPVFDFWAGANFHIRTKDKYGYLNYDDSSFAVPAPLHPDDSILERFHSGMIDLTEFEAEDKYKTYDELKQQMIKVLGAQFVQNITGEAITTTEAAQAGGNPFEGQATTPQGGDPFAKTDQQPQAQAGDPFAQTQQQQAQQAGASADPFAAEGSPSGQNPNTFEQQSSNENTTSDPFATPAGGNASAAAPQANVDPFAGGQAGGTTGADPFAGAASPDAGSNDPFANMTL